MSSFCGWPLSCLERTHPSLELLSGSLGSAGPADVQDDPQALAGRDPRGWGHGEGTAGSER